MKKLLSILSCLAMMVVLPVLVASLATNVNAAKAEEVYVCGVKMINDSYLASNALMTQSTKPDGGYAHFKDDVLTLNNFSGDGPAKLNVRYAGIYCEGDITINLMNKNKISMKDGTASVSTLGIYTPDSCNILSACGGSLTVYNADYTALCDDGYLTIYGATLRGSGYVVGKEHTVTITNSHLDLPEIISRNKNIVIDNCTGIVNYLKAENGGITIQNSDLSVVNKGGTAISCDGNVLLENNSKLIIQGADDAIYSANGDITIRNTNMKATSTSLVYDKSYAICRPNGTLNVELGPGQVVHVSSLGSHSNIYLSEPSAITKQDVVMIHRCSYSEADCYKPQTCSWCGATTGTTKHSYDNACDTQCNICSATRLVGGHNYVGNKCTICEKTAVFAFGTLLGDGEYLSVGSSTPTTTKPSGSYVYLSGQTLTMYNFSYTGNGTYIGGGADCYSAIYANGTLTILLQGDNCLDMDNTTDSYGIYATGPLTINEDASGGSLTIVKCTNGIFCTSGVTYAGGNVSITADDYGIHCLNGFAIAKGTLNITAKNQDGINAYTAFFLGGDVTISAPNHYGVCATDSVGQAIGTLNIAESVIGIYVGDKYVQTGGEVDVLSDKFAVYSDNSIEIDGGSFDFKSEGISEDSCALYGQKITINEKIKFRASTAKYGTLTSYEAASNDTYRWVVQTDMIDSATMFSDLIVNWAKDGIDYVIAHGYMNGTGNGSTFNQSGTMTRAMIVTVLYRMAGQPSCSGMHPFTDIESGWYYDAVVWAFEYGIVSGTSATTFSPNGDVTREQMATFLYRYAKYCGYDVSASADISSFPDSDKVGSWAYEALAWANAEGLITGAVVGGQTVLNPQGNATREQVATILMRFCNSYDIK